MFLEFTFLGLLLIDPREYINNCCQMLKMRLKNRKIYPKCLFALKMKFKKAYKDCNVKQVWIFAFLT